MFRFLVAVLALCSSMAAHAAPGLLTLLNHKPVWEFVQATESAHFACTLLGLAYWDAAQLASNGKGNADAEYREVRTCVRQKRDVPKEALIPALKYLEGKPGSSKALKDFYLKWIAALECLAPNYGESYPANSERSSKAEQALKDSQRALELELELGT